ncbi:MAG: ATP-binding protein [Candidatus Peribacteraceae bacterium]|nr:ATP-binding protein [Candidatus Peribacteraceae bacterium]
MSEIQLSDDESLALHIKAGSIFKPRTPINGREFFAGRWDQLTRITDSVRQTGFHIVLFGERGVGKTSLANMAKILLNLTELSGQDRRLVVRVNATADDSFSDLWKKAFDEMLVADDIIGFDIGQEKNLISLKKKMGINSGDKLSIDDVRRMLRGLKGSVFIFDEFDRADHAVRKNYTDLIKALSDYGIDTTIILVGVADTINDLVKDHASIVRCLTQIQLPRMNQRELREILSKASNALGTGFDESAASLIVRTSQGMPHYTHLIGLHSTREALSHGSRKIFRKDVLDSFHKAVNESEQSIRDRYYKAIHSAHKDALYDDVLLACAIASTKERDDLGYFYLSDVVPHLSRILKRQNIKISTFQKHINEFCEDRGKILEKVGKQRSYKYRFSDPLLLPYILMIGGGKSSEVLDE